MTEPAVREELGRRTPGSHPSATSRLWHDIFDQLGAGMRPRDARVLAVPVDQALAYTAARGWEVLSAPPAWWLEEHERLLEQDVDVERLRAGSVRALTLVPDVPEPPTSCRPGSGPCRRRHEHTSERRAG